MFNLILFINSFLSYLLLFAVITILVIIACIVGVKWKKASDKKKAGGVEAPVMPDMVELDKK